MKCITGAFGFSAFGNLGSVSRGSDWESSGDLQEKQVCRKLDT